MYARKTFEAKCFDLKIGERPDQNFLQVTYKCMNIFTVGTKIDNRIADYLTQTMISNLPATVSLKNTDTTGCEQIRRHQYAAAITAPADSQRMRMLKQQQRVGRIANLDCLFGCFLNSERLGVINAAQALDQGFSLLIHCNKCS